MPQCFLALSTEFPAVEALPFEIPEGSLFTLLGPNGARKTTTVRLLLVRSELIEREVPVMIAITLMLCLLLLDGMQPS